MNLSTCAAAEQAISQVLLLGRDPALPRPAGSLRSPPGSLEASVLAPAKWPLQSRGPLSGQCSVELWVAGPVTTGAGGGRHLPRRPRVGSKGPYESDFERSEVGQDVTGVELGGLKARNPATGREVPIWIAGYVLVSYGTGAIMAVPGHDERDWRFARKFGLPIVEVIAGGNVEQAAFTDIESGTLVNSGLLDGLKPSEAIVKMTEHRCPIGRDPERSHSAHADAQRTSDDCRLTTSAYGRFMRMRLHSAVLVTRRLDRLREFYTRTLGFKVTDDFGACIVLDCGLSLWQPADGHPVRACGGEDGREEDRGFPFELCFEADTVEEFESLAESLQRTGLPILHEVQTERWGQRTLRIQDPDGNLIEWGESIPCFVRRIYAASRNAADVASATGVALEKVQELVGLHPE